ncbi:MAG TPA: glycosyltransferase family 4 protein [Nitrososphaeraceae archaeon]|nr:glycosyltransferase family 4 protein [Nitrososphaeraceae archaeon]
MTLALLSHIRGDTYGGAEIFFSDVAKLLLNKQRFDEVICCFATSYDEFSDELRLKPYGIKIINTGKNLESVFLNSKYSKSRSFLGFYHSIQLRRLVKELQPELVFVAHEAFKPLERIINNSNNNNNKEHALIHYVHNPYEFVPDPSDPIVKPFSLITNRYIIKGNDFSDVVLANSNSTRKQCIKRWNRNDCIVLYPSIRIDEIATYISSSSSSSRDDICIVLSRLSPEKKIELAIEAFKTKVLKNKQLLIIGYLSRENKNYYQRLRDLSKRNENIKILPNLRRNDVLTLLSKAKILFHPMPDEHFGIAIIEAMAAGCLPVVHASGGPLEIVDNGRYGLIYRDLSEIPELLNRAFNLSKHFQHKVKNRALQFDIKHFQEKLITLINNVNNVGR